MLDVQTIRDAINVMTVAITVGMVIGAVITLAILAVNEFKHQVR